MIWSIRAVNPAKVHNFSGFTDGNRCVFQAKELGTSGIVLAWYDFYDQNVNAIKKKKLQWAQKLLEIVLDS